MEDKSFYSLEKVFNRIIERYPIPYPQPKITRSILPKLLKSVELILEVVPGSARARSHHPCFRLSYPYP